MALVTAFSAALACHSLLLHFLFKAREREQQWRALGPPEPSPCLKRQPQQSSRTHRPRLFTLPVPFQRYDCPREIWLLALYSAGRERRSLKEPETQLPVPSFRRGRGWFGHTHFW